MADAIEWGEKEIKYGKMSLEHPYVTAASHAIAGATSLPVDRAVGMAIDIADIASAETEAWMKPLIVMGWPKWQLMSEEDTKAEREEKKEVLNKLEKDSEFDKLNRNEKRIKNISDMTKEEQVTVLRESGLKRWEIDKLKTEDLRVDKIMGLQDKKQFNKDLEAIGKEKDVKKPTKIKRNKVVKKEYSKEMQVRRDIVKSLKKEEQLIILRESGLLRWEINKLTTEEMRIDKIIEFKNKKRKSSLK